MINILSIKSYFRADHWTLEYDEDEQNGLCNTRFKAGDGVMLEESSWMSSADVYTLFCNDW